VAGGGAGVPRIRVKIVAPANYSLEMMTRVPRRLVRRAPRCAELRGKFTLRFYEVPILCGILVSTQRGAIFPHGYPLGMVETTSPI